MTEILKPFDLEPAVKSTQWIVAKDNLIAFPPKALVGPYSEVLTGFDAIKLERPPAPDQLDKYKTIIVIDPGTPEPDEDLRVQSVWVGGEPWLSMGAIFPELRNGLAHFQTLQGVLFPKTVYLQEDFTINHGENIGSWLQALANHHVICLTHLLSDRKRAHTLEQLVRPDSLKHRLGIWGIGDIGTYLAITLRSQDSDVSGVSRLLIGGSRTPEKLEAIQTELNQTRIEGIDQPGIDVVKPGEEARYFTECDLILILVASDIPSPDGRSKKDVRVAQYPGNLELLQQFMDKARSKFDGQILIGFDPIEQLAWATYMEARKRGLDWNTHQVGGFGGMINRSRAANAAYLLGIGSQFVRDGRAYGPHGKMTLAFHTHGTKYDARTAEILSLMTALANYSVRDYGVKPYLGPAALITEGIRLMRFPTKGRKRSGVLYASPFLPSNRPDQSGAFFGCRVRAEPAAATFTPFVQQPYLPQIMDILARIHEYVQLTSQNSHALQEDPYDSLEDPNEHPAFHLHVMKKWKDKVTK